MHSRMTKINFKHKMPKRKNPLLNTVYCCRRKNIYINLKFNIYYKDIKMTINLENESYIALLLLQFLSLIIICFEQ